MSNKHNINLKNNLDIVHHNIAQSYAKFHVPENKKTTKLIAVSKNHNIDKIQTILSCGQRIFGENKVQEAANKWPELRKKFPDIELHMLGNLQSNKIKDAVNLFDVIQTIDRPKTAQIIAKEISAQNKPIKCFIQINTGQEPQKNGVHPNKVANFIKQCRNEIGLQIDGLMCIPPSNEDTAMHFALMNKLARQNNIDKISMGMSADYQLASAMGADYVRVGTAIFGKRPTTT